MTEILPLSDAGLKVMREIATKFPDLFIQATSQQIQHCAIEALQKLEDGNEQLFSERETVRDSDGVLDLLNSETIPGPSKDREHAELVHSNLYLTPSQMADERMVASINCFHACEYVAERWKSGDKWKSENSKSRSEHVMSHWFGRNKISNGIARIWWLGELAERASQHSTLTTAEILSATADNPNFYRQIMDRPYLASSDKVRAAVIEAGVTSGLAERSSTKDTSKMMEELNRKAGAINLDMLDNGKLQDLITDCIPKK